MMQRNKKGFLKEMDFSVFVFAFDSQKPTKTPRFLGQWSSGLGVGGSMRDYAQSLCTLKEAIAPIQRLPKQSTDLYGPSGGFVVPVVLFHLVSYSLVRKVFFVSGNLLDRGRRWSFRSLGFLISTLFSWIKFIMMVLNMKQHEVLSNKVSLTKTIFE
ncbi:hypothetical protein QBC38DRAFT_447531 [Podospora fimiseda]|uniref:Transmembrane protein n=1 Tax=Podospora fimiseda TaxID=252190 RepID=A0AAN7GS53_9PEZI|nr:hypothetical protein QBC38DRAFT_447531 [Podospora fimiseda]